MLFNPGSSEMEFRMKMCTFSTEKLIASLVTALVASVAQPSPALAQDYIFDLLVSTDNGFTALEPKCSINAAGTVAFTGTDAEGNKVFVANAPGDFKAISFFSANRQFLGAAINNAYPAEVASRDRVSGAPPTFLMRKWKEDSSGFAIIGKSPVAFDSATGFVDISDGGVVAFTGLVGDSTALALFAGDSDPPAQLAVYPFTTLLRPQISDDHRVVVRDDAGRIVIWPYPAGAPQVAAGVGFVSLGESPGISGDGSVVAFFGDRGNGPGVFLSVEKGGARELLLAAGEGQDDFAAFADKDRCAVYNETDQVTVVFIASQNGERGIYRLRITLVEQDGKLRLVPFDDPQAVARTGDSVGGKTLSDFSLYDPLNNRVDVAFYASFAGGTNGFVRASARQLVAIDGGVRAVACLKSPVGPPVRVFVDGMEAQDVRLAASQTKVYFTPPIHAKGTVDVVVNGNAGASETLAKLLEYTENIIKGVQATRRGVEIFFQEIVDESLDPVKYAPEGGALAEVCLHSVLRRATAAEFLPASVARSQLEQAVEGFLPRVRDLFNAKKPPDQTLRAVIRTSSHGQTLHHPVPVLDDHVVMTTAVGTLVLTNEVSLSQEDEVPTGGRLILPAEFAGATDGSPHVEVVQSGSAQGWRFKLEIHSRGGVQIADLRRPDDGQQSVARQLSVPTVFAVVEGERKAFQLKKENLSHVYIHENHTARLPGETNAINEVSSLREWLVSAVYRIHFDGGVAPEPEEVKPAIVILQTYAFSEKYQDFEPTHCLTAAHVFPRVSFHISVPGDEANPPAISEVQPDFRLSLNPQDTSPGVAGDPQNQYLAGFFKDKDDIQYWLDYERSFGFCLPLPTWTNIFECQGTKAPIRTTEIVSSEETDNIHLHHAHPWYSCLWCEQRNTEDDEPVLEAPGSFNGTIHLHWRWGSDYGERFGSGKPLLPANQTWRIGVAAASIFPNDPGQDFEAILGAIGPEVQNAILRTEKVVLVGCKQSAIIPYRRYETMSTGFAFAIGTSSLVCKSADLGSRLIGYWLNSHDFRSYCAQPIPPVEGVRPLWLRWALASKLVNTSCTPSPGEGGGQGPDLPPGPCVEASLPSEVLDRETPLTLPGDFTVEITSSPQPNGFRVVGNMLASGSGHTLAEPLGSPGSTLTLRFTPGFATLRRLQLAVNQQSGSATLIVEAFSGQELLSSSQVTTSVAPSGVFNEGFWSFDSPDKPVDRVSVRGSDPSKEIAISSFQLCSKVRPRGDTDGDGDVDQADLELFARCFGGANIPRGFGCLDSDLDGDQDVDCDDAAALRSLIHGPLDPGIIPAECEGTPFHRGDADDNGQMQLTDAVRILSFLFLGGDAPTCLDAADTDDNAQIQLTDAVRVLGFLFLGQAPPAPPGPPPTPCGLDAGAEHLGCASFLSC